MKDITSYITTDETLVETTVTTGAVNSSSVDVQDHQSGVMIINVGFFSFTEANNLAVKLQESEDNVTFTDAPKEAVTEGLLNDTDGTILLTEAADASKTYMLGYNGKKRYFRAQAQGAGTTSVAVSMVGMKANPRVVPTPVQYKR